MKDAAHASASQCATNPDWVPRWQGLLARLQCVPAEDEAELLLRLSRPLRPTVLAFANAHAFNGAAASAPFFQSLAAADVLLRDGAGVAVLLRLLGRAPGRNLNGTDLIPRLLREFNGRAIALLGTQEPYLQQAVNMVAHHLAIESPLARAHGFLETADYVALTHVHNSALIVLGMGMPRQEEVALALRAALTQPCLIVCGGAIIDFLGGKTPRAPRWMRRVGLEWVYRLAREPRRLFQRYVIGNPLFLLRALRLRALGRKAATASVVTRQPD